VLGLGLPADAQIQDTVGTAVTAAQLAAESWLGLIDRARYAITKPVWEDAVRKARGPFEPWAPVS